MNFEEHAAKPLLGNAGIAIPRGKVVTSAGEAANAAEELVPVVVKAQAPTGKRGKAGGIKTADTSEQAKEAARQILGMRIGEHTVERVLIEQRVPIEREFYAAVLNDQASKGPLLLFSTEGGMDIEEVAELHPDKLKRASVDIRKGFDNSAAEDMLAGLGLNGLEAAIGDVLVRLYHAYRRHDAELLEVNPLALTANHKLVALDCKFVMDDSGMKRHAELSKLGAREKLTPLEQRGQEIGLRFIELDGDVGVLANGAGLTMTTMDIVRHHGGRPANFLEIGGEAYTQARPALELVLANPHVKSLVVNFCGAFARTDVMTEGIINAWRELKPELPVFFSVHGTGAEQATVMLKEHLALEPFATMDEASEAAVEAAR
ncbi:MAG: succinate--CoA ligase subunit beta [Gammaproteobacteria bacterium]